MKIELFTSHWLYKVHSTKCKTSLVDAPLPFVGVVNKILWKLLVGVLASFFPKWSRVSIGFKESGQRCLLMSTTFKNSIEVMDVGIEHDQVVIRKMDLQSYNVWNLLMEFIMENTPNCIRSRDITTINKLFDFIS